MSAAVKDRAMTKENPKPNPQLQLPIASQKAADTDPAARRVAVRALAEMVLAVARDRIAKRREVRDETR
jgi:hypothetical protein